MSRPALRRITTGLLAGLALIAGAVTVAPAASAADLPRPTVSQRVVQANEYFTVSGTGCFAGSGGTTASVTITSPDSPQLTDGGAVGPDGTWALTQVFGPDDPKGTFRLQAVCDDYYSTRAYPLVAITFGSPQAPAECAVGCQTVAPGSTLTPDKALAPGEKRMLRLTGYLPNEVVTLVLHSTPTPLGTFVADASGTITVAFTAPAGTTAGAHNLVVTRADGSTVSYPVTIAEAAALRLASTGADVTVPVALGGGLLLAGAGALVLARRRGRGAAQA